MINFGFLDNLVFYMWCIELLLFFKVSLPIRSNTVTGLVHLTNVIQKIEMYPWDEDQ